MVGRRTEMIIAFLILLSPVTALQVGQAVGLNDTSTQVKSDETTLTYTSANMETYFGSSEGTTIADAPQVFRRE